MSVVQFGSHLGVTIATQRGGAKGPPASGLQGCLPQTHPVPSSRVGFPKLTLSPSPRVDSNTLSPVSAFGPKYAENVVYVAHMKMGAGVQISFNRNLPLSLET